MKRILLFALLIAAAVNTSFIDTRLVLASWYHTSGTRVHRNYPTAAMNGVPLNSKFQVTNVRNGKTCIVTITDRMRRDKLNNIDLSHKAFGLIEDHNRGVTRVTVEPIIE